ncbi:MAG: ABC transporter substrate-binding protein [Myxococcales bacterium]|nr:ABC transporter substrate-binding protein [Myxococcales bacterium]MDH5565091.1 ABC transporter substrate-binding protein [Myxococcales bacterium]
MRERCARVGVLFALACGLGAAAAALASEEPSGVRPRQIIETSAQQVLAILRDPARTQEQRIAELEKLAYDRFDFRTMTRLVLSRSWKKLSAEQQDDFVEQFTRYLANDYSSRLDRYEQQDVTVLDERAEPRGDVTVRTRMQGGEVDGAIIDYRMRERGGTWRIIDVVIEGISLVANLRDQFREVLTREGPEKLLEKLREKNAAPVESPAPSALAAPLPDWTGRPAAATLRQE